MAETFTDSKGVVFPLNPFGRPQGFFDGTTFKYPNFGTATAAATPAVDPTPVVTPLALPPARLPSSVALQQYLDDSGGAMPDEPPATNEFGVSSESGVSHGGVSPDPSVGTGQAGGVFGGPYGSGISPQTGTMIGEGLGNLTGIPGAGIVGGVVGGAASGRGGKGIGGNVFGTTLGTAIAGPFGALLGGPFGRIGDLGDMEDALGMQKTRGFWGSLGYGLGLAQSKDDQLMDYYGIPDYSTQSFTEQLEEDALDFEADIDPYSALSDAFGPGDMSGDMGEAYDESDPGEMSDEGETDEF